MMVLLVAIATTSAGHATTSVGHAERIVGWSADGTRWAVIVTAGEVGDERSLVVIDARGQTTTIYCGSEHCPAPLQPPRRATAKLGALERVDVETDRKLARFQMSAVQASWRADFARAFEIVTVRDPQDDDISADCASRLALRDRATGGVRFATTGCGILGGYLHPGGKHALVKVAHRFWDFDGARGALVTSTRYALVRLP